MLEELLETPVQRNRERYPLLSGGHPFLGFSEKWQRIFLYRPRDISIGGASLESYGASDWHPSQGAKLNLCLPFHLGDDYLDQCEVRWVKNEPGKWVCGGPLVNRTPLRYPIYLESVQAVPVLKGREFNNENALEVVEYLLEDAWFTKRAILIYFRHLAPMFSRTAKQGRRGHQNISDKIFAAVEKRIERNIRALETLRMSVKAAGPQANKICRRANFIDLLRGAVLSEIDASPLEASFEAGIVNRYLHSIRVSEHKLALNYNTFLLVQYWLV